MRMKRNFVVDLNNLLNSLLTLIESEWISMCVYIKWGYKYIQWYMVYTMLNRNLDLSQASHFDR